MEFGYMNFGDAKRNHPKRLKELINEMKVADEVGIDIYGMGEHHRSDYAVSSPEMVLAAGASVTENIRLTSAVTVLSSDDPVRVFERFSTLDGLSNGRAEIMAGRGSFIESFELFGYELNDYELLYNEKLELLKSLVKEEKVSFNGRTRASLNDVTVYPRPQQKEIPVWIATGGTPESSLRAADKNLPINYAIIGGSYNRFKVLIDAYRERMIENGHEENNKVAMTFHGYIAEDDITAYSEFFPPLSASMNQISLERGFPPFTKETFERNAGPGGGLMVGSVDTVVKKLVDAITTLGLDRVFIHFPLGEMPHELVLKSIRLYGEEVIPRVKQALNN